VTQPGDAPIQRPRPRLPRGAAPPCALLLAAALLLGGGPARAELPLLPPKAAEDAAREPAPDPAAALAREREELAREVERARAAPPAAPAARRDLEQLEQLDRILARHQETLARAVEIERAWRDAAERAARPPAEALGREPPYPVPFHDERFDAWRAAVDRVARLEAELEEAQHALVSARRLHGERESGRRLAREKLEAERDPAEKARLEAALHRRELESRIASADLALREARAENASRALEVEQREERRARASLEWVQERLEARAADLDAALAALDKREYDLGRASEERKLDLAAAERRLAEVQVRAGQAAELDPALRDELAARRAEYAARQRALEVLGERQQRVATARQVWRARYQLLSDAPGRATLREWLAEAERRREEVARQERIRSARRDELRSELAGLPERLAAGEAGGASGREERWIRVRARALAELVKTYDEDLVSLRDAGRMDERLLADLRRADRSVSLADRLREGRDAAGRIWRYEITASEDRPITVGKLTSALLAFLLGYLLARAAARAVGSRVLPRMGVDPGAAHAIESLSFYVLLVGAFLVALRVVNIPLTAFAVLGGALAIGVGFGSQNVVNNFMSGLILLAERPIKRGDLIEVGGIYGTVERIGLRSTSVRTGDNIHIIVPNASFLENNVINWTHNDETVRLTLPLGVVYGSPTREVARLVEKALAEHSQVLRQPAPIILFTGFGDNSLDFQARFWIRMRTVMDRLRVESDLRYRIDDLFREAGIVIAFPQRDVHLDTASPLEVRVLDGRG